MQSIITLAVARMSHQESFRGLRDLFSDKSFLAVLGAGILQVIVYWQLTLIGVFKSHIIDFIRLYSILFLTYLFLIGVLWKRSPKVAYSDLALIVLIFAAIYRSLMILTEPSLSNDIMRYLWDGSLVAKGISPYEFRPTARELDQFKDAWYYRNYDQSLKGVYTIYPPVTQLIFGLVNLAAGPNAFAYKLTTACFDLMSLLLVMLLLKNQSRFALGSIAYGWSPLLIVEFAGSGHLDSAAIFFLLASIILLNRNKPLSSVITFCLAAWTKLYPLLLAPIYTAYLIRGGHRILAKAILLFAGLSLVLFLPFLLAPEFHFLRGLQIYTNRWHYNSSLYLGFYWIYHIVRPDIDPKSQILRTAVYAIIFYFAVLLALRSSKETHDLIEKSFWAISLYLMMTPTMFQWYLSWIIAYISIGRFDLNKLAFLILSGGAMLWYVPYHLYGSATALTRVKQAFPYFLAEYVPFYAVLLFSAVVVTYRWWRNRGYPLNSQRIV